MAARARTDDWRYWHVGDLTWWFFMVACHLTPEDHIRLWHTPTRHLVGFAILGEDPTFDCQVLPEYAGVGIEAEALGWAQTRLMVLRRGEAGRWDGPLITGARQDDAGRIAFLEQHGFERGAYIEVNLLCGLEQQIPETSLPAGFQVRALAETGETNARAAAQREVWKPWTVGNVSDGHYARFMRLPGYHRDLDVVAVAPDGAVAAYVNAWIDPVDRIGDFGPVGARPAYRRLGLTAPYCSKGLRRLRAYGMNRVSVSTGETNEAARSLYASVGFRVVNRYVEYRLGG